MPDKKPRKPRKNYQKLVEELAMYCRLSIAILSNLNDPPEGGADNRSLSMHLDGQIATLKAVLAKLEGTK